MTGDPEPIKVELTDDQKAVAIRAAFACGLTVPEIAKAAMISKLKEFETHGQMTFGPGKAS